VLLVVGGSTLRHRRPPPRGAPLKRAARARTLLPPARRQNTKVGGVGRRRRKKKRRRRRRKIPLPGSGRLWAAAEEVLAVVGGGCTHSPSRHTCSSHRSPHYGMAAGSWEPPPTRAAAGLAPLPRHCPGCDGGAATSCVGGSNGPASGRFSSGLVSGLVFPGMQARTHMHQHQHHQEDLTGSAGGRSFVEDFLTPYSAFTSAHATQLVLVRRPTTLRPTKLTLSGTAMAARA